METTKKHTAEPWEAWQSSPRHEGEEGFWNVAECSAPLNHSLATFSKDGLGEANATRAATCVNACKGINPAAVPGLVGALEKLTAWEDTPGSHEVPWPGQLHEAINAARAALELAKPV